MKNLSKKISIIVVNFNAGEYLLQCLESLEKERKKISFDIWVVDNASSDGSIKKSREKFSEVNYLVNKHNLGFSAANNLVLRKIKTKYILLLNPDSKVLPGTIQYMVDYMEKNQDVGVATCKVEKKDGSLDFASHRGFPTPWVSFLYYVLGQDSLYHLTNCDFSKLHEVDAIAGAFFLTRKKVLDEVGLFDEDYFLYAEDLDLCFRIKEAGYKIMYVPEVKIIHYKGVTSGIKEHSQNISTATKKSKERAFNSFYETMIIFYKKHMEKNYPFFINWLVYLGINLKWFLAKRKMSV